MHSGNTETILQDKSRSKVGVQCFANRSAAIYNKIMFDMTLSIMSSNSICIALKEQLFKYPSKKTAAVFPCFAETAGPNSCT